MDYDYIKVNDNIIFFLHGWGGDKNSFSFVKNHITECSMVFVSFAGFGSTPPPNKPYFVNDYAIDLKNLIDKIAKGKKVSLVCHSFGARVAVKLINLYPELVDKLLIVDGAGLKPKRKLSYYFKVLKYKSLKKKVKKGKLNSEVLNQYGSDDYKLLSNIMKQTFINIVNEDLKDYYKNIKIKTLIFWGKKDTETPLYMAKRINKLIKSSKLFVLKNSGHFSYLEEPEIFIYKLSEFLL